MSKLGLEKSDNVSQLNPKICPHCKHPNLFNASICEYCGNVLDDDIGIQMDDRMISMRKFLHALSQDSYVRYRIEEMAKDNAKFRTVIESIGHGQENQSQ